MLNPEMGGTSLSSSLRPKIHISGREVAAFIIYWTDFCRTGSKLQVDVLE